MAPLPRNLGTLANVTLVAHSVKNSEQGCFSVNPPIRIHTFEHFQETESIGHQLCGKARLLAHTPPRPRQGHIHRGVQRVGGCYPRLKLE
jgi:hypothetical protein